MDFEEFKKYIEENCNAKSIFFGKMTTYMLHLVQSSDNNIYLTESQIENEVKKNWDTSIQNLYNVVSTKVKTKNTDSYPIIVEKWHAEMSEFEILDTFTESIDNTEFE